MSPPNIQAALTDLPKDITLLKTEESRMVIRQIKSTKAPGPGNVRRADIGGCTRSDGLRCWSLQQHTKERRCMTGEKKVSYADAMARIGKARSVLPQPKNIWNAKQLSES
ncbi:unnamed protein product [Schistosoma curassoni]|uniref:Uncharacterized protein n=1 Tax=Schistosoma curassoni TaxID=6186 RepID=A0A183KXC9_9TREM|nr:unnamed protein product [Schistosoma curassoni]